MVSASVDDVRDVIHIGAAVIPDPKVTKMLKRAEVTLELETDKEIDYSNCTDAEKEFITVLAAIYSVCYLTGRSAVGLSYYDVVTSGILWKIRKSHDSFFKSSATFLRFNPNNVSYVGLPFLSQPRRV